MTTRTECLPLMAERGSSGELVRDAQGPHSQRDYLADVLALSLRLPPGRHVLNFCQDRYRFLVGFGASLVAGKVSLLPSTRTPDVLRRIQDAYPETFCLHDGGGLGAMCADASSADRPAIVLFEFPADPAGDRDVPVAIPQIPAKQVAAHVFTSGSTGVPVPHPKLWGSLVASARAETSALGLAASGWALVGTVPSQHMYGFESLILLTLHGGATLWSGHPFYPADIVSAIETMPRPRMLVTTPAHLRALVTHGAPCPAVDKLLSATAHLPETLCQQAEAAFRAPLYEIYGSTETGQIASRRSSQTRHWKLLTGIELTQRDGRFWACGGHVLQATPLSDTIRVVDGEHFDLIGRNSDVINFAGKRGSLAFFNHALLGIPGVEDGCVFVPESPADAGQDGFVFPDSTRLCAVVVAPKLTAKQILRSLRAQVDPVFLPRPLIFVATLPRNATGKIPREALLELFAQQQRRVPHGPA